MQGFESFYEDKRETLLGLSQVKRSRQTVSGPYVIVPYRTPSGRAFRMAKKEVDGEIRREMAFDDTFSEPDDAVPSVCDMR